MADHGNLTEKHTLTLNPGEDFVKTFRWGAGAFPAGFELFYVIHTATPLQWDFVITGDTAELKIESEVVDTVPVRTEWQLMSRENTAPTTETEVCWGTVKRTHTKGL